MATAMDPYAARLRMQMISAVIVIARQAARKVVKEQLRGRGEKVTHYSKKEITILADDYLAQHPELHDEAVPLVERWRAEGLFGKRALAMRDPPRLVRVASVRNLPQIRTLAKPESSEHEGIQR